jgi:AcrR family transcriptional regulator
VTDIAERAEVGRATFFRHFGDKQEVVFADADELGPVMAKMAAIPVAGPIRDSLPAALDFVRAVVVSYVRRLTSASDAYVRHQRLVASHPELRARSLTKQRKYAEALVTLLRDRGADGLHRRRDRDGRLLCGLRDHRRRPDSPS